MDPSIFLQYSPPVGLPQESKLATYMNHSASAPTRSLNQALGKLSLESPPPAAIKKVLIGEFVPINYYAPNMPPESLENSPPNNMQPMPINPPQVHQENVGGTTYFYPANPDAMNASAMLNAQAMGPEVCVGVAGPSPYATQMYATPGMPLGPMASKSGLAESFYSPETIRAEIYERNQDIYLQCDLRLYPDLPDDVDAYTELTPLEAPSPHSMTTSFRVANRAGGNHYALRRLHSYSSVPNNRLDIWKQIDHPNIVRMHDYFTTNAFGDHSMVMVYDYHPACSTLMQKFLSGHSSGSAKDSSSGYHDPFPSHPDAPRPYTHQKNTMLRAAATGSLLPEAVLWSMLVQLTAALRTIHAAGIACRTLDPTKVVMNGCRIRISWCGVADTVQTNTIDLAQAQQEDLASLGRLILALACRTIHCDNLPASIDLVARTYSADLKNVILFLLTPTPTRRTVSDLMPMIGARFYTQVEALQKRDDAFEDQLAAEIDNGRLLRLMIKLGIVNERPELNMDTSWSETGDRYMLKLFRDYMFHAVTPDGRPWIDQAHLTHCLNQLDAGTGAKVELMSRDEESLLVVSYAELKHGLEQSVEEVMEAASNFEQEMPA